MIRRFGTFVSISGLAVLIFLIQHGYRTVDDNRLTRWSWVFAGVNVRWFALMIALGCLIAYVVSRFEPPARGREAALFGLSFAAAAACWGAPEAIIDASRYFTQAKYLSLHGIEYFLREWGREIPAWTDLPLMPFLYGLIFRIFGEARIFIQAFQTLLFGLTAVLAHRIGKKLYNEETGFLAGMLLPASPFLLLQPSLMLVDVPSMFFLTLAIHAFLGALAPGGALRIAFAAASIFLAFCAKYSLWIMLPPLMAVALLCAGQGTPGLLWVRARRAAAASAAAAAMMLLLLLSRQDVFADQLRLLLTFQVPGLERWGESFFSTFFFQVHPFVTCAALFAVFAAYRKKDPAFLIILLLPALMLLFRVERSRYIIPLLPMVALMAAYGLREVRQLDAATKRFLVLCAVTSSLVIAHPGYMLFLQRTSAMNLHRTGVFLNSLGTDAVEVRAVPHPDDESNSAILTPLLDIYTDKRILYRHIPSDAPVDVATSRFRFTWEYKNPAYYEDPGGRPARTALAVITRSMAGDDPPEAHPAAARYQNKKTFDAHEGLFQFRTSVTVYW